ncbi:uncharacterized protein LOC131312763 [Rhododendron vialii]|uniref:uncharacterized protein LOC131312763 n=1 Tax=Rhododendron vialii TaxID=182163 RepID=UPI00265E2101|nr:uncharacterized protein LOC131312763 [Rhododendron vialii]XP_058196705.1 uncharacterized protein LOC131312763 [Rhododendron vialii]
MVQLFLSEPTWSDTVDDKSVKHRISLLNELQSLMWSVLASHGGQSEARLWLCNSISSMSSVTPRHRRDLFVKILRSKPLKRALAAQILQMIFEKLPRKAGSILAKRSHLLEDFFKGNPRRILQWFSCFAGSGNFGHRKGAKALSQFAFVNRDICWEELEWKGKHGQSPAVVATKPHYFLDLDVQQTVENFIENVPEFWSSNEFADSLEDGEILFVDTKFFLDFFVNLMYKEDAKEVWELINDFLMEESFSSLCHHLLIILEERDFCVFLESLRKVLNPRIESVDFGDLSCLLEIILSKCRDSASIDQLLILNAVVSQGRQILRLLHEEGDEDEKLKIEDIVAQVCMCSSHPSSLAPIMKECFQEKSIESVKLLGLQSWALHYRLSEDCQSPESWESLFIDNGISFRKSSSYELLHSDGFSEEWESDLDEKTSVRLKRKKKEKRRKKRRKNLDDSDCYDNELLDIDMSKNRLSLQSRAGSWFLSTDGYSTSWSSVDLPEHLSKYCFSTWMKWVFARWGDGT